MYICRYSEFSKPSKYIHVHFHSVCDVINRKEHEMYYVELKQQLVDVFTNHYQSKSCVFWVVVKVLREQLSRKKCVTHNLSILLFLKHPKHIFHIKLNRNSRVRKFSSMKLSVGYSVLEFWIINYHFIDGKNYLVGYFVTYIQLLNYLLTVFAKIWFFPEEKLPAKIKQN